MSAASPSSTAWPARSMRWLDRRPGGHLVAAGILAAILVVAFWPALFGGRVFTDTVAQQNIVFPWAATPTGTPFSPQSDQADLSMPALRVQQRALEQHQLSHLDRFSYGGGVPLYTDFATGQGYPARVVAAALLDPLDAHLAFTILHVFLAGLFTYLFVRGLGARWLSAMLAATAWMLGGWTLGWMQLSAFVVLSPALPAALWAVHRAVVRRTFGSAVVLATVLGAVAVAGHVLFGVVIVGLSLIYGVAVLGRDLWRTRHVDDRRTQLRALAVLPVAGVVAAGLWAFILVPMAIARGDAARAPLTWDQLSTAYVAPASYLTWLVRPVVPPVDAAQLGALSFVGFLTVALAVVGFFSRREGSGIGRGIVLVMGLAMVGGPVAWVLFHLPTMSLFRPFTRLAFFLGFGVVLLAAVGLDVVLVHSERALAARDRQGWVPAVQVVLALLIAANAAHLLGYGLANNPAFPPDDAAAIFPETPLITALHQASASNPDRWPSRAVILDPRPTGADPWSYPILWAAEPTYLGIESSHGYAATLPERAERLSRVVDGVPVDVVLRRNLQSAYLPITFWRTARYDLHERVGYDLVVAPPVVATVPEWRAAHVDTGALVPLYEGPDGSLFRIAGAEAGAHGVEGIARAPDETAALSSFTDAGFDERRSVLLEDDQRARLGDGLGGADGGRLPVATISDAEGAPNGYRFTTTADGDTLVVVPVNWGPGWQAAADGQKLPTVRGNYNQVVVRVPAGTTVVSLNYTSPGTKLGFAISALTVLLLLAVGTVSLVRRRKKGAATP